MGAHACHPSAPALAAPVDTPRDRALALPPGWPVPLTPLVGRSADLAQVRALLAPDGQADTRLVTLTGAGGVGKTRLALQAAADLAGRVSRRASGWSNWRRWPTRALVPQAVARTRWACARSRAARC